MYLISSVFLVFPLTLSCIQSHVMWESPSELQPVHGLYVKPSIDGTTGDLYVAASEDSGQKSQWLTDQPINFLPAASKRQTKAPLSLTSSVTKTTSPQEDTVTTQKRAVITSPTVKYAYPMPLSVGEENVVPYPYAIPGSPPLGASVIPPCSSDVSTPPYSFNYYYPQIMSAIANAMNSYKDQKGNEENNPIPTASPYWPQGYGYPFQFIMIDPIAWAQSQANVPPLEATSTNSDESS